MLEASGQIVLLKPWFSNRTKSIVKSPKLYLADSGLLCALLNIRSEEAFRQSPAVGAVRFPAFWMSPLYPFSLLSRAYVRSNPALINRMTDTITPSIRG
jgi:predicted AAA+ superfamily ATPase